MLIEKPLCPVFGKCGGCQYQDLPYQEELRIKEEHLKGLLVEVAGVKAATFQPILASPSIYHYRHRLDLKLKKQRDGKVQIGFSAMDAASVLEIAHCPIAMSSVSDFIPQLRCEALAALPTSYRMANLTVRCGEEGGARWCGIGDRPAEVDVKDYFFVTIRGLRIHYALDTFFQANLSILPKVIEIFRSLPVWSKEAVFFDLYGGVGLFGLCVHDLVRRSVNIEENARAVQVAQQNIRYNHLTNVLAFAGKVEAILPSILAQDIPGDHIVMVDPPRAGLSQDMVDLLNRLSRVRHVIYLSCEPESLVRDLAGLTAGGWRVVSFQPLDLFPRTRHLETLAVLTRDIK